MQVCCFYSKMNAKTYCKINEIHFQLRIIIIIIIIVIIIVIINLISKYSTN